MEGEELVCERCGIVLTKQESVKNYGLCDNCWYIYQEQHRVEDEFPMF